MADVFYDVGRQEFANVTPSIDDLRADWIETRDGLLARCAPLRMGQEISSADEFAASAWRNRLRAWCRDVDEILHDYPGSLSRIPIQEHV